MQFSINELAEVVREAALHHGLVVEPVHVENHRVELEEHYYNAKHTKLRDLGLDPHLLSETLVETMFDAIAKYRDGLHQMREGEADKGHALMQTAAAELAADGDRCVTTPGCEPQRFMAAYGNLLSLRSRALADAVEDFELIEPREGTG